MSEEITSLQYFRASLQATRHIVASIRADLETAIQNHAAFQDNVEDFGRLVSETRQLGLATVGVPEEDEADQPSRKR